MRELLLMIYFLKQQKQMNPMAAPGIDVALNIASELLVKDTDTLFEKVFHENVELRNEDN